MSGVRCLAFFVDALATNGGDSCRLFDQVGLFLPGKEYSTGICEDRVKLFVPNETLGVCLLSGDARCYDQRCQGNQHHER